MRERKISSEPLSRNHPQGVPLAERAIKEDKMKNVILIVLALAMTGMAAGCGAVRETGHTLTRASEH
jgi:hypothetical protein